MSLFAPDLAPASRGTDIYSVLGEPDDPASYWKELRFFSTPDTDYIFISRKLNTMLAAKSSIAEFIIDVLQVFETQVERTELYIYAKSEVATVDFAAVKFRWMGGTVQDFHIVPVKLVKEKRALHACYDDSVAVSLKV